ncbi:MAG: hypothetical protein LBT68_04965, partial [Spirochaetales bacterium]|nr:hypothetical protein [Spirochaetales bacterium]
MGRIKNNADTPGKSFFDASAARFWILLGIYLLAFLPAVPAFQTLDIFTPGGQPLFRFYIFDEGESFADLGVSTWTFGAGEVAALK